ncbi:MAG: hypothetical protein PWP37_495 [Thermotogota bacterium]|nr:hypothetical protein [Thermotogota bacterium]MDK2864303.1 hypothetical protein [Thermotogota bacterium]HCZ05565.1 hypothetical protein [Thermotogota bacterium]
MRRRCVFIFFILMFPVFSQANTLILRDFLLQFAGVRDYSFTLYIDFHVRDVEGGFVDTSIAVDVIIRNGSDFYIKFLEPTVVSDIELVYISQKHTLITRYKDTEDVFPGAEEYLAVIKNVTDVLSVFAREDAFETESMIREGNVYKIRLLPKTRRVLSLLGIDYSIVELVIAERDGKYMLEEFNVYNSLENEYMRVRITNFAFGETVARKFPQIPGGGGNGF